MYRFYTLFLVCLLFTLPLLAEHPFHVTIIYDGQTDDGFVSQTALKAELETLVGDQYQLSFQELFARGDAETAQNLIDEVYAARKTDVLIGAGLLTSNMLLNQKTHPLPAIAAIHPDFHPLKTTNAKQTRSSIPNFTYIQKSFDISGDLEVMANTQNFGKIAILRDDFSKDLDFQLEEQLNSFNNMDFAIISIDRNPQTTLDAIAGDVDAVYVMSSLSHYTDEQSRRFFGSLAERKTLVFSYMDDSMLEQGAYAAFSSQQYKQQLHRRIAIHLSKIARGENPEDFQVRLEDASRQLYINMETVRQTGIYPNFHVLDNALLFNLNVLETEHTINLLSAIAEGLENNLGYRQAQQQTEIAQRNVALARIHYLPKVEASSTGLFLDEFSVTNSFGTKGDFNWSAAATLSQLILSEPAMANIAIQKLLKESEQKAQYQSELDVVLDVATAYFNHQQLKSFMVLQGENIRSKHQNLLIARNKLQAGYSGESDVHRWESELALARADYNEIEAQEKAARYHLNQILNRPVDETISTEDTYTNESLTQLFDPRMASLIENPATLDLFADFLVNEAMNKLPELQQLELALKAQERLVKSEKRAHYVPTVAVGANYENPILVVNPGEQLPIPGIDISPNPSWNAFVVASFPIFDASSGVNYKKSKIEMHQMQNHQVDVRNKLEMQIRANLDKMQTSYRNLQLRQTASEAARKNAAIVQDLYNEGQVSVTTLIDAQNAALSAEINASHSLYQFLTDLFALERSTGTYNSLATREQRTEFLSNFMNFTLNNSQ